MRITAGKDKGRSIRVSKKGIRPTKGIVRQAIFNVIGDMICGASVLDLFAGSGALGIEAISRGARFCTFIERSPKILFENLRNLLILNNTKVLSGDFRPALKRLKGNKFDIVFIDPPYRSNYLGIALKLIREKGLLNDGGMIVAEHPFKEPLKIPDGYLIVKEKRFGNTAISFIKKEKEE